MIQQEDRFNGNQNLNNNNNNNNCQIQNSSSTTDDFSSDTCSVIEDDCLSIASSNDGLSLEEIILKKERIRQQTVNEIVKTETNYVRDLKLIVKLFIDPIRSKISIREYHDVFGCTERLLDLHRDILAEMESIPIRPPHLQNIGEVYSKFFSNNEYSNLYVSNCQNQMSCYESFEKLKTTSKVFANCIEEATKGQFLRGLSFQMLIIKPIQRITKYPLLIKSLVENTSSDHPDFKFLIAAQSKINIILEEVNYKKKLADEKLDNEKKLKEIEVSLYLDDSKLTGNLNRLFIREGLASKKIDKEFLRLILCNDLMILAKNKKNNNSSVKHIIHLKNILIRDGIESLPGVQHGFEIMVLEKKEKIFSLYFQSESEKKEWFQLFYSMTNQISEQALLNKYKWFVKKSNNFNSSASSTPPFSIDISALSPSTSKESSPKADSLDTINTNRTNFQKASSFTVPSSTTNIISGSNTISSGNGSISRKPPPPPRVQVQDLFKLQKSNESTPILSFNNRSSSPSPPPTSPFILDSPPIFSIQSNSKSPNSTLQRNNPSPNSTLKISSNNPSPNNTLIVKKQPSPTNTLKQPVISIPTTNVFTRASSVPSFGNADDDMKPTSVKKMPPTIASIPTYNDNGDSNFVKLESTPRSNSGHQLIVSSNTPPLPSDHIAKAHKLNSKMPLPPPLLPPPPLTPPPFTNFSTTSSPIIDSNNLPLPPPPIPSPIATSTVNPLSASTQTINFLNGIIQSTLPNHSAPLKKSMSNENLSFFPPLPPPPPPLIVKKIPGRSPSPTSQKPPSPIPPPQSTKPSSPTPQNIQPNITSSIQTKPPSPLPGIQKFNSSGNLVQKPTPISNSPALPNIALKKVIPKPMASTNVATSTPPTNFGIQKIIQTTNNGVEQKTNTNVGFKPINSIATKNITSTGSLPSPSPSTSVVNNIIKLKPNPPPQSTKPPSPLTVLPTQTNSNSFKSKTTPGVLPQ